MSAVWKWPLWQKVLLVVHGHAGTNAEPDWIRTCALLGRCVSVEQDGIGEVLARTLAIALLGNCINQVRVLPF